MLYQIKSIIHEIHDQKKRIDIPETRTVDKQLMIAVGLTRGNIVVSITCDDQLLSRLTHSD